MIAYAKLGGVLAAVLACLAIGYHFGEMPYKTKYEALQADNWKEKAQGEAAAKTVIAGQLVALQTQVKVNSDAMQNLANQNAQTTADRDVTVARVHRLEQLLSAPATRTPASGQLPQAGDRPPTAGAGGDPSADEIGDLLIGARDEAKRNANRLDALIAEINPQL